ncbi:CsgE family curli-type amyloid fiber assembly protein [Hymenobacter sp. BT559]|uniref:CsgE family curli-type amyloid fiber assembly protein n=1 Tax=Hymenobacter sp. BT559 TaxID=2795729 RepID=UPI0018EDC433|nr:CsgE family curli-type amyloid fiber assembly protein [Hymenobacter sp. BT559]
MLSMLLSYLLRGGAVAGWGRGRALAGVLLLSSGAVCAQVAPAQPPAAKASGTLPAAQVEEALRLLLRADSTNQLRARGPESAGLVLDQTITKLGRDFFDMFYVTFEPPAGSTDYTIAITERPGRIGSALVALTVNDVDLFEIPLSPQYEQMMAVAAEAVAAAQSQLLENQRVSRQLEAGRRAPLETF